MGQFGCIGRAFGPLSPPAITQSIEKSPPCRNHAASRLALGVVHMKETARKQDTLTAMAAVFRRTLDFRRWCRARHSAAKRHPMEPFVRRFAGVL